MPWCERCDRFLNPNTVALDGTCPSCRRTIEPAARSEIIQEVAVSEDGSAISRADGDLEVSQDAEGDRVRAPWHFWLMIALVAAYLGWRLIQGAFWAAQNWF